MLKPTLALAALVCLLAAGCDSPTQVRTDGDLRVTSNGDALELRNRGPQPLYYFVVERQASALIDWAPCTVPATCASVPPGGRVRVPYASIAGYAAGAREAIVFWWRLEPVSTTQFRTAESGGLVIRLQ